MTLTVGMVCGATSGAAATMLEEVVDAAGVEGVVDFPKKERSVFFGNATASQMACRCVALAMCIAQFPSPPNPMMTSCLQESQY